MKKSLNLRRGITAVELLIVVAIIGVLAMIAVPRLIESQTRAKLARIKTEMRKGKMGLEAFHFDHKWYPPDGFWICEWTPIKGDLPWVDSNVAPWFTWEEARKLIMEDRSLNLWRFDNCLFLTTPVAYLTSIPKDPFVDKHWWLGGSMLYGNYQDRWKWSVVNSPDPQSVLPIRVLPRDGAWDLDGVTKPLWVLTSMGPDRRANGSSDENGETDGTKTWTQYDPSNGTVSRGDIFAAGP